MNRKRVSCILLSLLLGSSVTSFADIPNGTVVIDNKAYDLKYANKEINLKEIYEQCKNSKSDIYVKAPNGKWYKNSTGKEISKELIPQVIYKDENGKVFDYSAQDGTEIELAVEKVNFISDNQVKIQFNKKMMGNSVLNKSNYRIGERNLSENDIIDLKDDGKTVVITLEHKLEDKILDTSIFISEKILDINNNSMNNSVTKNILVINDKDVKLDKELNKDVSIILDNYRLNDVKINGDIYINADNVKVNEIVSSGNIIINDGENRKTELLNSEFKKVDVLSSGKERVTLSGIKADTLRLKSKDTVKVTAKGSTKIDNTIIQSAATLERLSGSLGQVKINIDKGKETESLVELKGKFEDSIIMESGARLNVLQGAQVNKLNVRPFYSDSIVSIEGAVKNVEVNKECVLNISKKANITNEVVVNCKSRINGEKGAKVKKLNISPENKIDKINISGEFKDIEILEEANISFGENTIVHKLVAYKNAILNGDKTVDIKEIQADKDVEIKKENNNVNNGFNLPTINPIKKSSGSTYSGGGSWGGVSNSKPEAKNVVITGEVKVGQEITADYEYYDKNSDKEGISTFKWYRADNADGTNKTDISNEKDKTYTLTNSDKGKYIAFEVTPIAKSGEKTGTAVMSKFVGPVEEVVVEDTEKPVITLKGSKSVELQVGDVYEDAGATALDNVDGDITNKIVSIITDQQGNSVDKVDTTSSGQYTIHYNVSDKAGNEAKEVTRTVIVNEKVVPDTEKPVITLNGSDRVELETGDIYEDAGATAVDNVDGDITEKIVMTITDHEGNTVDGIDTTKSGKYTISYGVSDNAGNKANEVTRTVTVKEVPQEVSVKIEVNGYDVKVIVEGEQLGHSVSIRIINKETGAVEFYDSRSPINNKVIFKKRIDKKGEFRADINPFKNGEIIKRDFKIEGEKPDKDTVKPSITLKGKKKIELEVGDAYEDAGATAMDDVDGDITDNIVMTVTNQQGNSVEKVETTTAGEYTVHYNVSDQAGNAAEEVTRTVIVNEKEVPDTEKPVITLNGSNRIELETGDGYEDAGATAVDNVDGDITDNIVVTVSDQNGHEIDRVDTTTIGEYTIHYNVSDKAGNEAKEVTRTVIVNEKVVPDTEKPVITLNGSDRVELETGDIYEDAGATAVDNIDGDITDKIVTTVTDQNGHEVEKVDTTTAGQYTIHYNVSDQAGNTAVEVTRTVIVNEKVVPDTEKPVITLNGTDRVELETGDEYEDAGATAVDNVDGDLTKNIVMTISNQNGHDVEKVDTTVAGKYTIHYNVSDQAGNAAEEVTRTVIVNEKVVPDTEKPVITLNGMARVELETGDDYEDAGATAMDNVDGDITDNIVMTVTNQQGNGVEKVDTTTAGEYTVHYNVSDQAGNVAEEVTRTVIVNKKVVPDTEKPVITLNGSDRIELETGDVYEDAGVTAVDNVDGDITENIVVTVTDQNGHEVEKVNTTAAGQFTIHYNVSDQAGNAAEEVIRTVIVNEKVVPDTEKPVITLKGSNRVEIETGDIYEDAGATAVDNVDGDITDKIVTIVTDQNGHEVEKVDTTSEGQYTIHYNVSDQSGNTAVEVTRTVIVNEKVVPDTEKPVITLNGSDRIKLETGDGYEDAGATAVDNVDGDITDKIVMTITDQQGYEIDRVDTTVAGQYTIHYNVSDQAGNAAEEVTRKVIVNEKVVPDTEKPVITLNGSDRVELETGDIYEDAGATAVDNVDGDITDKIVTIVTDQNGHEVEKVDTTSEGQYTIHYNVSDQSGNTAVEVTRTVVVNEKVVPDTEKPVITLSGRKVVELEVGDIYEEAGATAVDNVDGNITDKIVMTIIDEEGNVVEKVDTAIAGEYTINYDVSDAVGNVANRVTRYVIVKEVSQEEAVKVEVNGYNVKITVEGENLKDSVSVKIINNQSEAIEDIQTKSPVGNRVVFERRIEKAGEFTAYINAFKDDQRIEKTFTIQDEDPNNDTVKPILTLKGNSNIDLVVGDVYEDAGATALDNVDGDITDNIIVTILDENGREVKEIDTTKKGVYTIYYRVRDNAGNAADSIKRNVIVKEAIEDKRVQVEVNGYNVKITVEGEDLKDSVSLKIKNKETGEFVDAQTKASVGNKVVFDRRIEKAGEFISYVNGFKDGEIIEKTFTIKEEPTKDTIKPVITLKGNSYVELEIGDVYKDAGATAVDNVDGDITDKIVVTMRDHNGQEVEKVDTTKPGQYSIHYNVSDKAGNGANELTRTVIVKEVVEEGPVKVEVDGYNVTITVDGEDLKDSVSVKIINSQTGILEDIQTKSPVGNKVVFVRRIEKTGQFTAYINAFKEEEVIEKTFTIKGEDPNNDTVKPIITLKGNSNVELEVGDVYEEAGATAVDNVDGNITSKIVMTIIDGEGKSVEKVDTSTSGEYTIHYNVSDKAGNAANELTRTVTVKEVSQDEAVKIEVNGYNVKITVEGENLRNSVSITITNKETGELVDVQQKSPVQNKVVFERRIEESGEFTANIKAFKNGQIIEKDFRIN